MEHITESVHFIINNPGMNLETRMYYAAIRNFGSGKFLKYLYSFIDKEERFKRIQDYAFGSQLGIQGCEPPLDYQRKMLDSIIFGYLGSRGYNPEYKGSVLCSCSDYKGYVKVAPVKRFWLTSTTHWLTRNIISIVVPSDYIEIIARGICLSNRNFTVAYYDNKDLIPLEEGTLKKMNDHFKFLVFSDLSGALKHFNKDIEVYELHPDDTESLLTSEAEIIECFGRGATVAAEWGKYNVNYAFPMQH